jgi:hypothetical protein
MAEKNRIRVSPQLLVSLVPVGTAHLHTDQLLGHLHLPGDDSQITAMQLLVNVTMINNLVPVGTAHLHTDQLLGHLHVPGDDSQITTKQCNC